MLRKQSLLAATLLASLATFPQLLRAENPTPIGSAIDKLTFKDVWFLPRTLTDLGEHQAYVLAFVTVDDSTSASALATLNELEAKYANRGVTWVAVNVGPDDSIRDMAAQRLAHEARLHFVKDLDGSCCQALGVEHLAQVVVLDSAHHLRYRGRIDDRFAPNGPSDRPTRHDLVAALDNVLADRQVATTETELGTQRIPEPNTVSAFGELTFAEHIEPLMRQHCQECHRPNTEAPFSLITYEDVSNVGEMVAEVVTEQRMPPWYASHGTFTNNRDIPRRQREMIAAWVRSGMPTGELSQVPPPEQFTTHPDGWLIDEPDLIIKTREAHKLPAHGYVPYKYVILPHVFQHDTWIQQCEILPDNPRVVHHCNMAYIQPGKSWTDAKFVIGKVPGVQPMQLTDNIGFRLPKGAMLILQIHYTTTGQEETCQIAVGMRYARELIHKEFHFLWMVDTKFAIPPGDPSHRVMASQTLDCNALGAGLFSHMHLRGKDMSFIAHYPDGTSETLLEIPNFSFDWQLAYAWDETGKRLPKGTRIDCIAHYDNSTFNPYNPDPAATVTEGQQTFQEMLNGVFFYMDEDEHLDLHIDPQTGAVLPQQSAAATSR